MEQNVTVETASMFLGISWEDWQETIAWDTQRHNVSEREETKIQSMQEDIHRVLLDGGNITKLTDSVYNHIFDKHLGTIVRAEKMQFNICTKKQLETALAFLVQQGLSRSLAGRWDELSSGNTYKYRSTEEQVPRTRGGEQTPTIEISKAVEQLELATVRPAINQKVQSPIVLASSPSQVGQERGRSPVRRRYITSDEENPPSFSRVAPRTVAPRDILISQSQHSTPKRIRYPYRPLAMAPSAGDDTIMQDAPSLPLHDQTVKHPGSSLLFNCGNGGVPHRPTTNEPKPSRPSEQPDDHSESSTILVQPKRAYTGTARPTAKLASSGNVPFAPLAHAPLAQATPQGGGEMTAQVDFSTGDPSEAMERLKRESLKHSAKPKPKPERPVDNKGQSGAQMDSIVTKRKNVKNLSVSTSNSSGKQPVEGPRRASTATSTGRSRSGTAGTPEQGGQGSPITPMRSGSSPRTARARQLPARFRDSVVETPTAASRPRKTRQSKGISAQAKAPATEGSSRRSSKGELAAAEDDKDDERGKRLATSPPGSRGPAAKKRASLPTPGDSRSDTAQSSKAHSVVSVGNGKDDKGKGTTARPKAGGKAPRKRPSRATL